MANAPKPLVLRKEDYKDAPEWVGKLFEQLNGHISSVTTALDGGLTTENHLRVVKVITFTTLATPADTFPITVKHGLATRPEGVRVDRLRAAGSAAIASPWSISWELDAKGEIRLWFQGLSASTVYEARLTVE